MTENISFAVIIKAISNEKRLEILNFIHKEKFLIKNDLISHFELQRAGLDFHLSSLEEAGLIGVMEIKIKSRKFVFVYPKAEWKISVNSVDTVHLNELIPTTLSEKDFHQIADSLWTTSSLRKNPQTIKKVLKSLVSKFGIFSKDFNCHRCQNEAGIMKCNECDYLYCPDCAKIIKKANGAKLIYCYECIADHFS
ncbi:MAG: ArsR family transcriptional regulator [Candidatus Hodarchaeales archaeon]|jgi:DNA-binding transcriptional ArsR family regulator